MDDGKKVTKQNRYASRGRLATRKYKDRKGVTDVGRVQKADVQKPVGKRSLLPSRTGLEKTSLMTRGRKTLRRKTVEISGNQDLGGSKDAYIVLPKLNKRVDAIGKEDGDKKLDKILVEIPADAAGRDDVIGSVKSMLNNGNLLNENVNANERVVEVEENKFDIGVTKSGVEINEFELTSNALNYLERNQSDSENKVSDGRVVESDFKENESCFGEHISEAGVVTNSKLNTNNGEPKDGNILDSSTGASSASETFELSRGFLKERTFASDIPRDVLCTSCRQKPISHKLLCGHTCCFWCIKIHLLINNQFSHCNVYTCPCGTETDTNDILPISTPSILRQIGNLRVYCVGKQYGCNTIMQVKDIERHENSCDLVETSCTFFNKGCPYRSLRKKMARHEARCRRNPVVRLCQYAYLGCRVRGEAEAMKEHGQRCRFRFEERYVYCPNRRLGCDIQIKKMFLRRHILCCPIYWSLRCRSTTRSIHGRFSTALQPTNHNNIPVGTSNSAISVEGSTQEACRYHCEISVAPCNPSAVQLDDCYFAHLRKELSKFIPNVSTVSVGNYAGEISIIIKNLSHGAVKGIMLATDPNACRNLAALGLVRKGFVIFE